MILMFIDDNADNFEVPNTKSYQNTLERFKGYYDPKKINRPKKYKVRVKNIFKGVPK